MSGPQPRGLHGGQESRFQPATLRHHPHETSPQKAQPRGHSQVWPLTRTLHMIFDNFFRGRGRSLTDPALPSYSASGVTELLQKLGHR